MIEKLMDEEASYGEPRYSELSRDICRSRELLLGSLDEEGRAALEKMEDAYLRQETAVLRDAFVRGFCAGLDVMMEYHQNRRAG